MKNPIFSILTLSLLFACKKDKVQQHQPDYALNVGSKWIYEILIHHPDSGYKPIGYDTVVCTQIVQREGKSFYEFQHSNHFTTGLSYNYYRTEAGKFYRNDGVLFKLSNQKDTIAGGTGPDQHIALVSLPHWTSVVSNSVEYRCLHTQISFENIDGSPFSDCEKIGVLNYYFADGIGQLIIQIDYFGSYPKNCEIMEERLIAYEL